MEQHGSLPLSTCIYKEDGQELPMLSSRDYKQPVMGLAAGWPPGATAMAPPARLSGLLNKLCPSNSLSFVEEAFAPTAVHCGQSAGG